MGCEGGVIVAPNLPTCHDKVYDFFVVSKGLIQAEAIVGIQRIENAGTSPHWPSRLLVRGDARRKMVRKLVRSRKVPAVLPFGPLPDQIPIFPDGIPDDEKAIDAAAITWHQAARKEWNSLGAEVSEFKDPKFKWVNAVGPVAKPTLATTNNACHWRQFAAMFEEVANLMVLLTDEWHVHDLAEDEKKFVVIKRHLRKAANIASGTMHPNSKDDPSLLHWIRAAIAATSCLEHPKVHMLVKIARMKAERHDKASRSASQKEWKVWLNGDNPVNDTTSIHPTKRAFLYVKGTAGWLRSPIGTMRQNDEVPDEDTLEQYDDLDGTDGHKLAPSILRWYPPGTINVDNRPIPLNDQAAIEHEAGGWAALWAEGRGYHLDIDTLLSPPPEPLQVAILKESAMSFPIGTGLGGDNVSPRAITRLTDALIWALCLLLAAIERTGYWPTAVQLVLIVLLPKSDGGLRPIGLFPTLIRVWMKARVQINRTWEAANALPSLFGGTGMGAQRAAWQSAFRAENAARLRSHWGGSLLDLIKAFEKIPHHRIVEAATRLGYNLWVLRLSLAAYRLPRTVGVDGVYSRLIIAVLGITAGSGSATTELRILMLEVVTSATRAFPIIEISLYVDDLTIEAWHKSRQVVACVIAAATKHVCDHLQLGLDLAVSVKKSVTLGSSIGIARKVALLVPAVTAVHSTKLLGTSAGGGRRRAVRHLVTRVKSFKFKKLRIKRLRSTGINTEMVTRAAGTPMLTYGVECSGMSNSHLLATRRPLGSALAAQGGGKSLDIVLHLADANGSTIDSAFDAHVLPVYTWALARWQVWQPTFEMDAALIGANILLLADPVVKWRKVTGPATAVIATCSRLNWTFTSATKILTDDGAVLDISADPPVVIALHIKNAVRRWRLNRIIESLPHLVPESFDLQVPTGKDSVTRLVDFTDTLGKILKGKSKNTKGCEGWKPEFKQSLRSAIVNGQWSQARIASVPGWADDTRCQLCMEAAGTLAHRHVCRATRPPSGWPAPPPAASKFRRKFDDRRKELLCTRGLLVLKVKVPRRPSGDTFQWFLQPPEDLPEDAWWFIDGSMFDANRAIVQRTGFGITIVAANGTLLGFGNGVPPDFVQDSAGAELWAFFKVCSLCAHVPLVVTDCLGILNGLKAGAGKVTGPKSKLARTWCLIAPTLDFDLQTAADRVTWMPAHTSQAAVGHAKDSKGNRISSIWWRANRLVDFLAKSAASPLRVPKWFCNALQDANDLCRHNAAKLGQVTHAANNFKKEVTTDGGGTQEVIVRDSVEHRRYVTKRKREEGQEVATGGSQTASLKDVFASTGQTNGSIGQQNGQPKEPKAPAQKQAKSSSNPVSYKLKTAHLKRNRQLREDFEDEQRLARWLTTRDLAPSTQPTAGEKLEQLRKRLRARTASS